MQYLSSSCRSSSSNSSITIILIFTTVTSVPEKPCLDAKALKIQVGVKRVISLKCAGEACTAPTPQPFLDKNCLLRTFSVHFIRITVQKEAIYLFLLSFC